MFYEELREIRKRKGFTIREVADKSGVSTAYISQLENGQRGTPSPEILNKLSDGLESSYEELMKLAGYMEDDSNDKNNKKPVNLRRFIRDYPILLDGRLLTEQDVRWIDRMLTAMFSKED